VIAWAASHGHRWAFSVSNASAVYTSFRAILAKAATMIVLTEGDIIRTDAEALVNTVNCVGHMGRGIAAQSKRAFPRNFAVYHAACKRGEVQPGAMFIFETGALGNPRSSSTSRQRDTGAGRAALWISSRGFRHLFAMCDVLASSQLPCHRSDVVLVVLIGASFVR